MTRPGEPAPEPDADARRGLSAAEAAARLARDGPNALPRAGRRGPLRIAVEVAAEPMSGLLLAGAGLYLLLGSAAEGAVLLGFAAVSILIAVVQESRSERVLDRLRDLSSPRALVIRDGVQQRIPGSALVAGDLVLLAEGDRVPGDAWLLSGGLLLVDESLMTGEAVPVSKRAQPDGPPAGGALPRPGGDDLPLVFSGTLVVRGQGLARVVATGPRSELGRIGGALGAIAPEPTRLARQTRRLVRVAALAGGGAGLLAVLLTVLAGGGWLDGLLAGIAIGMSLMPEEFPLVLAVFTVMGAWRISRARVLTRRAAAIESLGATTVLCTDKTGTLTLNRMTVAALQAGPVRLDPAAADDPARWPPALRDLARHAALACAEQPVDPMERACRVMAPGAPPPGWRLAGGFALAPDRPAMTQIWDAGDGGPLIAACKGAPETVAALAGLDTAQTAALRDAVAALARDGLRVLAVAGAALPRGSSPADQAALGLSLLGLVGFADPLRPEVPAAVRDCRAAGIRVVMITGDHAVTAQAIARAAGLGEGALVTGAELAALDEDGLRARVADVAVFARILPEQKLRIVEALKAGGAVVAMTGDGVNDAPSLRAAHIGVAMGGRGTDVAREAAAIVLLDDDFGSLVRTVRLGRRIHDNIRKAFGYIVAVHVPVAGVALLPLLLGWPVILGPVHIAFIELVIDPVCSIVFEAEREESDLMRRPPRDPADSLVAPGLLGWGLLQGAMALLLVMGVFLGALRAGLPEPDLRALVFVTLVLTNVGLIITNRSFAGGLGAALREGGALLWGAIGGALALLAAVVGLPPARALFGFGPLHADDVAASVGAGLLLLVALQLAKRAWRRGI